MAAPILVVSGCSAVGKSTVSGLLRSALEPGLHLQSDVFCRFFADPFPDPASPEGIHRYNAIGAAQAAAAVEFALGNFAVILDGNVLPEGAQGFAEMGGRRGVGVHYAVLRTDFDTCLQRAWGRDSVGPRDYGAFAALHSRFSELHGLERHALDASGSAQQVADAVLDAFRSSRLALTSR